MTVLSIIVSITILISGLRMRALESRALALLGSILAIVPINWVVPVGDIPSLEAISVTVFLAGIAAGVWSLTVLTRPEVAAAFRAVKNGSFVPPKTRPKPDSESGPLEGATRARVGHLQVTGFVSSLGH